MVRYEIKKVFSKTGSKVAVLLLLFLLVITCYFATDVYYVNESGISETGFTAVAKLRTAMPIDFVSMIIIGHTVLKLRILRDFM